MHRDILNDLIKWQNKSSRKPLLVTGVRQCGKTYTLLEFANKSFKNYVYVNFEGTENLSAIFDYDFDVKRVTSELSAYFKTPIIPGETLLIFDEIQECPRAITSLKYFCENVPEYHIAVAGSLLGIAEHKGTGFPVGKADEFTLYPLSFEAFRR